MASIPSLEEQVASIIEPKAWANFDRYGSHLHSVADSIAKAREILALPALGLAGPSGACAEAAQGLIAGWIAYDPGIYADAGRMGYDDGLKDCAHDLQSLLAAFRSHGGGEDISSRANSGSSQASPAKSEKSEGH